MTTRHTVIVMLCMAMALTATGQNKKEMERQLDADLTRLITLAASNTPVHEILRTDQTAYDYCANILTTGEELYAADTATINAHIADLKWVLGHRYRFDDSKTLKKLQKKHPDLDPHALYIYYEKAELELMNVEPRYTQLRTYCDKTLLAQREAKSQVMPKGRILSLRYEEHGSSRPTPVTYHMALDTLTHQYTLSASDPGLHDPHVVTVGNEVETHVRQLIEQYKIYQEQRRHTTPPAFRNAPIPLGGAAAWSFECQLEGGDIVCGSGGGTLMSRGCVEVMQYLKGIIKAQTEAEKP